MGRSKIFLGCFGLGLAALVVVVIGARVVHELRTAADVAAIPERRAEKAREILGVGSLPEGYHAMRALRVPFVMNVVTLSDRAPGPDGLIHGFDERAFVYIEFTRFGPDRDELMQFFDGRTDDPEALRSNGVEIEIEEILGRGRIVREDAELFYLSQRGSVRTRGCDGEGITTLVLFECPEPEGLHLAVWYGADSTDEEKLARFMEPFRFCGP